MYMPAEWEPHSAVWLGWEEDLVQFHPVISELVQIISPNVDVKIAVSSDSLVPKYSHAGSSMKKEIKVKEIFEAQFPKRKIVFIDAMAQNWWGGGIHCSTQQQPKIRN